MFLHPQSCSVCCVGYGDSGGVSPGKGQTGVPPRPCMPFTMPTWDLTEPVLSEVVSVLCVLVIPRCIDFRTGILRYCWGTGDLWHSRKEIPWCLRLVGSHGSQQFHASVWDHVVTETGVWVGSLDLLTPFSPRPLWVQQGSVASGSWLWRQGQEWESEAGMLSHSSSTLQRVESVWFSSLPQREETGLWDVR